MSCYTRHVALGRNYDGQDCSLARALEVVGERWTLLVVRDAFYGVRRYADFVAHLDIPRAILADRLLRLTQAGILVRRRYQDSPPREEYLLTDAGRELWGPIYLLAQWGERHLSAAGPRRVFSHHACGTRLDPAGACPHCAITPAPEDLDVRPGSGARTDLRDDPVTRALARPHRLLTPLWTGDDAREPVAR